ncbi:putative E3 ubiquitin-protein ligase HERC2 [Holothuria leucospilota]|uniref:E3 ubiquitin-protein ligase HERC2 n=1 Tax=Holothuria leucospilota TaxID=206669 RepID=A0A9Q1CKK6_HOLLE|nr:putative E3 ubiquitin-protein ligase HERC2 [Holothuria leucospilota]
MAYHLFHLSTLLSVSDEDQTLIGNTHHYKRQSGTDGKAGTADHGIYTSITKCAFDQVDDISVSLIICSNHFITLLVEEAGRPPMEKSVQWFLASGKTVKAVRLIGSCLWALLVTADASLYILPVLPLVNQSWKETFSTTTSSPKYSTTDITTILLKNQKHTKPTSLVCWSSQFTKSDVCIVGTEEGEVVFVDLKAKQEVMRVRIGDAVMSLELVHYGKSVTYLLISTVSNNQFGLLLEQKNSTAGSLTNSLEVEASDLEYTLVKSSDAISSILGSEVNDPMFRPLRFDQFLRTVQLSTQIVKGNCLIIAHCLCSNILKVYDSSLDSWLTLFVYSIPISSDKVLLTDHFIFALTRANKLQHTTITVLSSKLSETSGYEHHHSSDAKMQKLLLPAGERIIGIYKQLFPTVAGKTASVSSSDDGTDIGNSGRSEADRNIKDEERKGSCSSRSFVDGCIIFTDKAVYQIKPRLNFEEFFLSLIDEGSNKQAENLGMTLDLDMSSLFVRAAEHRLQQREVQEAIKLFRLSRSSLTVQALLLTKHNFLQEALSVIENALGKQGDVSHSDCRKLANIAIKCLICQLHKSKNKKENIRHLQTFLADNFDYDEVAAICLLGEHSLWDAMLEMARTRGHVMVAMETVLDKCPLPMSSSLFKKLKSPAFVHAFVSAKNGAFMEKLSTTDAMDILMSKVDLIFRHLTFIEQSLPSLTVLQLLQLAVVLDPTKPKMRSLFETHRGRSLSSSSITSLDSSGSLDFWSEEALLPDANVLVKSFILILTELYWRRIQDGYNISQEPLLSDIDRDYVVIRNSGEEQAYVSKSSGFQRNLVSCGRHHTGLISSGELYTWGSATHGRLGHGSIIPVNGSSPPLRVETLHMHHQQVIAISCGNKHTLALTSTDKVYAWGSSAYGQLGTGDRKIRTHPTLVEELQGRGCVEIVCGQYHCLARTQGNRVWSWGWGVHGQLGHGDIEDQLIPKNTPIASLLDKDIVSVGAGACHSGVLSSDGKVWMFWFRGIWSAWDRR